MSYKILAMCNDNVVSSNKKLLATKQAVKKLHYSRELWSSSIVGPQAIVLKYSKFSVQITSSFKRLTCGADDGIKIVIEISNMLGPLIYLIEMVMSSSTISTN